MLTRLLLALLVLAPLGAAQSAEPDLSRYGSLARQQIVRQNLENQRQQNYLRMRRRIREQLPPTSTFVYQRSVTVPAYSAGRTRIVCREPLRSQTRHVGPTRYRRSEVLCDRRSTWQYQRYESE